MALLAAAGCTASRSTATAVAKDAQGQAATRVEAFSAPDLGFELDKPAGTGWAMATNVTSPEGRPIPVVVAHPESGAQIVVQVSEPAGPPEKLVQLLRGRLREEKSLDIGKAEKVASTAGLDAYGFPFQVKGEAAGRVAIIQVGDRVVLVVASWPENADDKLVHDIDDVVKSVRPASGAEATIARPDRA